MELPEKFIKALQVRGYTLLSSADEDPTRVFQKVTATPDRVTYTWIDVAPDPRPQMFAFIQVTTLSHKDRVIRTLLDRAYIRTDLFKFLLDLNYLNF